MANACPQWAVRLDGLLDRELAPEEARTAEIHVAACSACREEFETRRRLKEILLRVTLPPPLGPVWPARFRRPLRRYISAAAAAAIVVALVLLSLPTPVPEVVALSARLHEDYLGGLLPLQDLGLKVPVQGMDYMGQCVCPPELGTSSPFIVYRKGTVPISLLITEVDPGELPPSALRHAGGRAYYFFGTPRTNAVVCRSGRLCHVWVSRLEEPEMVDAILATREGRRLMSGERLTLEGIT